MNIDVSADEHARAFIEEHGGKVYVWASDAGLEHVATTCPTGAIEFRSIDANGFTLHADTSIEQPAEWTVVLRHVPHKHIEVLWDGKSPGYGARPSWPVG
jgi:hypothetical protein